MHVWTICREKEYQNQQLKSGFGVSVSELMCPFRLCLQFSYRVQQRQTYKFRWSRNMKEYFSQN